MIPLTAEWAEFVDRQVKEKGYASSADVVELALAALAARELEAEDDVPAPADAEQEEIRQHVLLGMAQIERGECTTYAFDAAGRRAFLEAARQGGLAEGERRRAAKDRR